MEPAGRFRERVFGVEEELLELDLEGIGEKTIQQNNHDFVYILLKQYLSRREVS